MRAAVDDQVSGAVSSGACASSTAVEGALRLLAADGLVAFPTETVWGLAARAASVAAVERLRAFKGRDDDKPLSILVADVEHLSELCAELSAAGRRLAAEHWPGPLTLIVRCRVQLAPGVAGEGDALGLRCSSHPVAIRLAQAARARGLGPVTATSLNRSGEPPARSRAEALSLLADQPQALVLAGEAEGQAPSTVVRAIGSSLEIVRAGAVPADRILAPEREPTG